MNISELLAERGGEYGEFSENARITQEFMSSLSSGVNFKNFSDVQKQGLHTILHKIARLVCGNVNHKDSYIDIAGYSTLILENLKKNNKVL